MIKVVLDCYGGDYSPRANLEGGVNALNADGNLALVLTGNKEEINNILSEFTFDKSRIEIIDAKDVISCDDMPTEAIRKKSDSSMVKAYEALNNGADALVSIGSTGALLAGSVLKVGRIRGVSRPALVPTLPTVTGGEVVLLDAGANADCKPQNLFHFALMGSVYATEVLNIKNPRVALLSNGTEDTKGNELTKQVHTALKNCPTINFVGNVEGREILSGNYDVVVTDGFSGNIALKSMEGIAGAVFTTLKASVAQSFKSKIGALLMKKSLKQVKDTLDYNKKGGAVFLGVRKVVVKSHGAAKASAITAAILQAKKACENNIIDQIKSKIEQTPAPDFGENS
ncbi:MAG: phosphate acyltransferase PlsX [Clostridia bacterium]|nr:phosphate acyltransferase PlsX [Clostridia bacterium]